MKNIFKQILKLYYDKKEFNRLNNIYELNAINHNYKKNKY